MELLEKNHEWISDGTHLAFTYFMLNIVPKYIQMGINKGAKHNIYIPIGNKEDGVYVGNENLGRIYYHEFISYIFGLRSYMGLKIIDSRNFSNETYLPFDINLLIDDYVLECEALEYYTYDSNAHGCDNSNLEAELITKSIDHFNESVLRNIIEDAFADYYRVEDVLSADNSCVCKTLYLPLEIRNDNIFVGKHNFGKINFKEFIDFLTNLPGYCGQSVDKYNLDGDFFLCYDLRTLIGYYCSQNVVR